MVCDRCAAATCSSVRVGCGVGVGVDVGVGGVVEVGDGVGVGVDVGVSGVVEVGDAVSGGDGVVDAQATSTSTRAKSAGARCLISLFYICAAYVVQSRTSKHTTRKVANNGRLGNLPATAVPQSSS